jgi:hypothetical protein
LGLSTVPEDRIFRERRQGQGAAKARVAGQDAREGCREQTRTAWWQLRAASAIGTFAVLDGAGRRARLTKRRGGNVRMSPSSQMTSAALAVLVATARDPVEGVVRAIAGEAPGSHRRSDDQWGQRITRTTHALRGAPRVRASVVRAVWASAALQRAPRVRASVARPVRRVVWVSAALRGAPRVRASVPRPVSRVACGVGVCSPPRGAACPHKCGASRAAPPTRGKRRVPASCRLDGQTLQPIEGCHHHSLDEATVGNHPPSQDIQYSILETGANRESAAGAAGQRNRLATSASSEGMQGEQWPPSPAKRSRISRACRGSP